jgi:hypothetical protein
VRSGRSVLVGGSRLVAIPGQEVFGAGLVEEDGQRAVIVQVLVDAVDRVARCVLGGAAGPAGDQREQRTGSRPCGAEDDGQRLVVDVEVGPAAGDGGEQPGEEVLLVGDDRAEGVGIRLGPGGCRRCRSACARWPAVRAR